MFVFAAENRPLQIVFRPAAETRCLVSQVKVHHSSYGPQFTWWFPELYCYMSFLYKDPSTSDGLHPHSLVVASLCRPIKMQDYREMSQHVPRLHRKVVLLVLRLRKKKQLFSFNRALSVFWAGVSQEPTTDTLSVAVIAHMKFTYDETSITTGCVDTKPVLVACEITSAVFAFSVEKKDEKQPCGCFVCETCQWNAMQINFRWTDNPQTCLFRRILPELCFWLTNWISFCVLSRKWLCFRIQPALKCQAVNKTAGQTDKQKIFFHKIGTNVTLHLSGVFFFLPFFFSLCFVFAKTGFFDNIHRMCVGFTSWQHLKVTFLTDKWQI